MTNSPTKSPVVGELQFRLSDLVDEVDSLSTILADNSFIDAANQAVLNTFRDNLEQIGAGNSGTPARWEIGSSYPLVSAVSDQHEGNGRRASHHIYASISCVWIITPVGSRNNKVKNRVIIADDLAQVQVELFERLSDHDELIGAWSLEKGESNSPGPFYHSQIKFDDALVFPRWLSVPRLPSFALTPASAIETIFAELFQEQWSAAMDQSDHSVDEWIRIQKKRLPTYIDWLTTEFRRSMTSPWITLKNANPPGDIFK